MSNTTYISTIVKLLENPKQNITESINSSCEIRAQFPFSHEENVSELITLVFWGLKNKEILTYYQSNDYIIVEGALVIKGNFEIKSSEEYVEINVSKIYPLL